MAATARMLTRRSLLGGLSTLGAGLALAACGGATASPTATTAPKAAEATKPAATAAPAAASPAATTAATTAAKPAATSAPAAAATTAPTAAAAAGASKPAAGGTLKMGLIPDENSEKVLTRFKAFIPFMEQNLDMKVDVTVGTDYSATIEAMKSKKIDLAFFGPFSYILAADVASASALVMPAKADGSYSTYNSVIITHKASPVKSLDDLKGKSFSFADPASTSGHLIPRSILVKHGYDVDKEMKPIFAGGHDASVLAVANQKVDAGATYVDQIERMDKAGVIKKADLVVLRTSDPIPDGPIAVRKDYDQAMAAKLVAMFEKMPAALIKEAYGGSGPDRWVKGDDKVYDSLRDVAKVLKLDLTQLK